jgi:predicted amidohydrolase
MIAPTHARPVGNMMPTSFVRDSTMMLLLLAIQFRYSRNDTGTGIIGGDSLDIRYNSLVYGGHMERIRIALVQMKSKVGEISANSAVMRKLIDQAAAEAAALICFPETSLTGYDPSRVSELSLMRTCPELFEIFEAADDAGIAVCFGMFERAEDGNVYIAQPLHAASGTLWHRKTHLGSKEQLTITPGQTLETIDVGGVRFGVEICWETHYPELASIQRAQGAQVILMPFASGISGLQRRDAWMKYIPARASDNGMYVLACNALLDTAITASPTAFGGGLLALDPHGEPFAQHFELGDHMMLVDLDQQLPREAGERTMGEPSFFDSRRPELFARYYAAGSSSE